MTHVRSLFKCFFFLEFAKTYMYVRCMWVVGRSLPLRIYTSSSRTSASACSIQLHEPAYKLWQQRTSASVGLLITAVAAANTPLTRITTSNRSRKYSDSQIFRQRCAWAKAQGQAAGTATKIAVAEFLSVAAIDHQIPKAKCLNMRYCPWRHCDR